MCTRAHSICCRPTPSFGANSPRAGRGPSDRSRRAYAVHNRSRSGISLAQRDRFAPQGETIAETAIALDLIRGRRRIFDRTKFVLALPALGKLGGVGLTGRGA